MLNRSGGGVVDTVRKDHVLEIFEGRIKLTDRLDDARVFGLNQRVKLLFTKLWKTTG